MYWNSDPPEVGRHFFLDRSGTLHRGHQILRSKNARNHCDPTGANLARERGDRERPNASQQHGPCLRWGVPVLLLQARDKRQSDRALKVVDFFKETA